MTGTPFNVVTEQLFRECPLEGPRGIRMTEVHLPTPPPPQTEWAWYICHDCGIEFNDHNPPHGWENPLCCGDDCPVCHGLNCDYIGQGTFGDPPQKEYECTCTCKGDHECEAHRA